MSQLESSASRLVLSTVSIEDAKEATDPHFVGIDKEEAAASSTFARRGSVSRARARSVSSNAVPVSQMNRQPLSRLQTDVVQQPDRGPGTPDFTLSSSIPSWRRVENERTKTMSSLGQGLQLISEAERIKDVASRDSGRPRSSSDASTSSSASSSSNTQKKKTLVSPSFLLRPRLSSLRSFLSKSFTAASPSSTMVTPTKEPMDDVGQTTQEVSIPVRPQPLAMPSARPAGPNGLHGLNEDSPPLTPTSESGEPSEYQQYLKAFQSSVIPKQAYKYQGAPKHQWSAAQAAADAVYPFDERSKFTPPPALQWPFTPPLTNASSSTSPAASNRTFSSFARPDSTFVSSAGFQGILPSHMMAAYGGSRPPTPTSTATDSSDGSSRIYYGFDADSYRIGNVRSSLLALLPRIQVSLSSWRVSMPNVRPYLPQLFILFVIFVAATSCIVFMLSTLPLTLPKHITNLTLAEIKEIALSLKLYSQSSNQAFLHTLVVLGTFFTWKQSFTVPGSLIMNVVFGAMYGTYWGTLYTSVLTAVGGVFCYLLSAPLGPLITTLPGLSKPLGAMRRALSPGHSYTSGRSVVISNSHTGSNGNVWTYLLVLRVLPIVPYGVMNIACGVLRVPLVPYAGTLAVGSIPWNFVTCQVGDLLQEIVEALPVPDDMTVSGLKAQATNKAGGGMKVIVDHIWNREMMLKLILLSIASLLPMFLSRYLKRRQLLKAEGEGYEAANVAEEMADQQSDEEFDRPGFCRSSRLTEDYPGDKRFGHARQSTDHLLEASLSDTNSRSALEQTSHRIGGGHAWL